MTPKLWIGPDAESVSREAASRLAAAARSCISRNGRFSVGLSGGATPRRLYELLAAGDWRIDWSKVHIFFSDERCVPPDHPESTYRMALEVLLAHVPIPPGQVHRVAGEVEPDVAAGNYATALTSTLGSDLSLDVLLLGVGDDGHTASLFPGSPALREKRAPAVAVYAEHLHMWRVSLTIPVINAAEQVMVLITGPGKANIVRRILTEPAAGLPIQLVQPHSGHLHFLLDAAAAAALPKEDET